MSDWVSAREQGWRDAITVAALDPFRGYANALRTTLPQAIRVLDAFHVVRLGLDALDQVRRRVQQDTWGAAGTLGTRCSASASCCAVATTTTRSGRGREC
jgi:transposase